MLTPRSIPVEFDEERIAQLLTRDAWSYFSSPTELNNRVPVRAIPPMPRDGRFEIPGDPQILTYYLTFAGSYFDELKALGWPHKMYADACERFVSKLEQATGLKRRATVPDSRAISP